MKPIFINRGAKSAKTFFLIALALILMHFDLRSERFHQWRNSAEIIIYPLQWAVNVPHHLLSWASNTFSSRQQLLDENAALRAQQLVLFARLQKMLILEQENNELRELLKSSTKVSGQAMAAELLALSEDPSEQVIIVNRGQRDKIHAGQPVLDAFGIVGQVIDVTPLTSKVMLLTDARSAIPVQSSRNSLRAIAMGLGAGDRLALKNVPETSDVKVGDIFVASGLGSRYPVGYPVGKVIFVGKSEDEGFTKIVLQPLAHLNRATQVLLLNEDPHAQHARTS